MEPHSEISGPWLRHLLWVLFVVASAIGLHTIAAHFFARRPISSSESAYYITVLIPIFLCILCYVRLCYGSIALWIAPESRQRSLVLVLLPLTAITLAGMIFYFGNRQFGAWDYGVAIDTGWRQMQGWRPYVDFPTPNPPGFNLGCFLAFRLFGVSWNGYLAFSTLFSLLTFFWSYWLLRRLSASPIAAWFFAFALQSLTFVLTDSWWYNNATQIMACIFLLSVILCAGRPGYPRAAWISYAVSLGLLVLLKPNIAGICIAALVLLLLVAAPAPRWKMVGYTAAGAALAIGIIGADHISIPAMLACYRAAAVERGLFSAFGLSGIRHVWRYFLNLPWLLCSVVLLGTLRPLSAAVSRRDFRSAATLLVLLVPLFIAFYGIRTDADFKFAESAIVIAAGAAFAFAPFALAQRGATVWSRQIFVSFTVALVIVCFYGCVVRGHVVGSGLHVFYEPTDNVTPIRDSFFSSLTATPRMARVQVEVHEAVATLPQPFFFGPRLEYEYADFRLASPRNLPVYYQPGTSIARRDDNHFQQLWEDHRFATLVFLGDDRTFYTVERLAAIDREYVRVPGYNELQVYVRRQP